ncbi:hypothetical protein AM1_5935 [Acaryochloris marina MBIC11017]|uniref:Uncharacterized protein n=1 Tax=Acaryochloris marina (strain MBIC 11017) TaxID=329726 RepID=B0C1P0_ACAM1|nr:hypothetical protein AM1_5935 [Acaryochloris marina MBIC11017]
MGYFSPEPVIKKVKNINKTLAIELLILNANSSGYPPVLRK